MHHCKVHVVFSTFELYFWEGRFQLQQPDQGSVSRRDNDKLYTIQYPDGL